MTLSLKGIAIVFLLSSGLMACAQDKPEDRLVSVWVTSADGRQRLEAGKSLPFAPADENMAGAAIRVLPGERYQSMVGFGASMTDASAYLINRLPDEERSALLGDLFGGDGGLGLDFLRLTIGASDFSKDHYTYDDIPVGMEDPGLDHFSLAPAEADLLPVVKDVRSINPGITLMASPWSAPAWMKTSKSLITGRLNPEHYASFAAYLDRYLGEMEVNGLPISYLTIQNEPHFEPGNYPGMRVEPAARAEFVGKHLGPRLAESGRQTGILDWDHNWDQPQSPLAVLRDETANQYISGVAWHCYAGDVSAQGAVHAEFPDKDVFFTECSGGEWAPEWGPTAAWITRNLVIGATRNWARGVLLWNIALDEKHGPHAGGCGDCRGIVTIDSQTGAITRNIEYYVLGHASRFVRKGAVRVGSNTTVDGLLNVAFLNTDGSMALIVLNDTNVARDFWVQAGGQGFKASLAAGNIATFSWQTGDRRP